MKMFATDEGLRGRNILHSLHVHTSAARMSLYTIVKTSSIVAVGPANGNETSIWEWDQHLGMGPALGVQPHSPWSSSTSNLAIECYITH